MDALERETNLISLLSPEVMQVYLNAWQHWTVPKDHHLLREHEVCDYIFFIKKGIARIYYHKNGKEVSEWFATDEQFFLSITSFFNRTPSKLIIHTLELAEVMGIHHNDLMRLAGEYHEIETMFRKMLTGSLILSQLRMDSIQFETAQQRYEGLVKNSPEIIKRIPLSYIASFLGITLETLSRIRSGR
ncbi:MAG: Crp/Fnr family transcriptional regulator [Ferruginibacter sp.]